MTAAKVGNYMVFFPSYRYLDDVCGSIFSTGARGGGLDQGTAMNEAEREAFLAQFQSVNQQESSVLETIQDKQESQPKKHWWHFVSLEEFF